MPTSTSALVRSIICACTDWSTYTIPRCVTNSQAKQIIASAMDYASKHKHMFTHTYTHTHVLHTYQGGYTCLKKIVRGFRATAGSEASDILWQLGTDIPDCRPCCRHFGELPRRQLEPSWRRLVGIRLGLDETAGSFLEEPLRVRRVTTGLGNPVSPTPRDLDSEFTL